MAKKKSDEIAALDAAQVVEEQVAVIIPGVDVGQESAVPAMTDPSWSDYVMKQFAEDEIFDGNPTVDGLRRVAELLIGEIISSQARSISWPGPPHDNCTATVEFLIEFAAGGGLIKRYTEVADVTVANTEKEYAAYPSATAATRAEGRALRKALKLKRIVAAEEVKEVAATDENPNEKIGASQINYINIIARQIDVDVIKFINSRGSSYKSIKEVTLENSRRMIATLSEYKRVMSSIPDAIRGYKEGWNNG